ncbi:MAG TPA: M55 family metallopeptidase [Armatimonadota bacterium]|nr:M55 family metallopeptidase [Armatimonadota bacterium]
MRVFIATDLEGVGGVLLDEQVSGDSAERERARRLLTQEVNAAVEGALEGGAAHITVDDGHATGFNFIYEELHPAARYAMGRPRPEWLAGLSRECDAAFFIGCHAMAGTQGAVRDHTMSSVAWHNLWMNGRPTGEIGLWAAIAGHHGVPCVLVSGCEKACQEAAALVPGIETVVTKRGLSRGAAFLEPVETVRRMIRAGAATAGEKAKAIAPLPGESPVELRVEYNLTGQADEIQIIPGRERLDARTIAYRAGNVIEALRLM